METKHFVGKVSLRAIIVRDEKVLLIRDTHDQTIWEIPGGRLHEGEGLSDALAREIKEELGVAIDIGNMVYSEQFYYTRDGSLALLFAYEATLADQNEVFQLDPAEVAEIKWITKSELAEQHMYQNCRNALEAYWSR